MKTFKHKSLSQFVAIVILIVLINFIGGLFFARIDLTSEKRYTLSDVTKKHLESLNDVVFFQIYLEGDELSPGLERLKSSIEEMLNEFKVIGGTHVDFEFINPNESANIKEKNQLFQELIKKGLNPMNIQERTEEGSLTQKTVFPGGIVYYKGNEVPIDFLINNPTLNPEQNLNSAIEDLEFNLMSTLKKLSQDQPDRIAFIEGHGELSKAQTADLGKTLKDFYAIERVKIDEKIYALSDRNERDSGQYAVFNKYKAIIIAGPTQKFSEKDKFIIDQYIMNGGRVLWLLNGTNTSMDSLAYLSFTMAMIPDIDIDDQLFTYGIRVNSDLIQDMQCSSIPLDVSQPGSKYPDFKLFPWSFFPLVTGNYNHPISRNLNLVKHEFVSSIDTIGYKPELKKTPLLTTSNYSKKLSAPVRIDLNIINQKQNKTLYNKSNIPTAYLLEGVFKSVFVDRMTPQIEQSNEIRFQKKSIQTKQIVVADASIMRNSLKMTEKGYTPYPLEKDKFTGQIYGNKDFLVNAVHYLCDDSGILNMRTKEYKIRLLDPTKITGTKTIWQITNVLAPLGILILIGLINWWIRLKKYTR